jgi:hypothetical protein
MPGPVSDSYDPEFGTGEAANAVRNAIDAVAARVGELLGPELRPIVGVVEGPAGTEHQVVFSERELRVIRFAMNRASETI